jgi:hypothetical protein
MIFDQDIFVQSNGLEKKESKSIKAVVILNIYHPNLQSKNSGYIVSFQGSKKLGRQAKEFMHLRMYNFG